MMKGLMGRCLNHETVMEDELNGLKAWKVGKEKKFNMLEKVRKELDAHMETIKKVLEDKEKKIQDAKDQLRQAKEAAIHEYCDYDALLEELGTSYEIGRASCRERV